jgi:hypothetical protein
MVGMAPVLRQFLRGVQLDLGEPVQGDVLIAFGNPLGGRGGEGLEAVEGERA